MLTTTVKVQELSVLADVGINQDEIGRRQPLIITCELKIGGQQIFDINQTIDYRTVATIAEDLALVHTPLIETFAHRLAEKCLELPLAYSVRVAIDKPFALARGRAGVEVLLSKP